MFGELLCVTRQSGVPEKRWGFAPGQTIWVNNDLGDADVNMMLAIDGCEVTCVFDWRAPVADTILTTQRSRHGWVYVPDEGPFNADFLRFDSHELRLPDGDRTVLFPVYAGQPARLMFPRPSDGALEQARDPSCRVPVEPLDYLTIYPCWPAERMESNGSKWQSVTPASDQLSWPVEQPSTVELRRRLALVGETLFRQGIVLREVASAPVGEAWWGVVDHISPAELLLLGKTNAYHVSIAWYSLVLHQDEESENTLRERTDPERLVEEWWDRLDRFHEDEPAPGQDATMIYFMGQGGVSAAETGTAVAEASYSNQLRVEWSGNSKEAIKVCL